MPERLRTYQNFCVKGSGADLSTAAGVACEGNVFIPRSQQRSFSGERRAGTQYFDLDPVHRHLHPARRVQSSRKSSFSAMGRYRSADPGRPDAALMARMARNIGLGCGRAAETPRTASTGAKPKRA